MDDMIAPGFTLPPGLLGRFGVIKLWPDIQVAEDELIARLINAAKLIGLECIVLDHMGCDPSKNGLAMTDKDLDFVIHMHFSTPKSYDIFSFVTLWNPPEFFHDFGYQPMVENLLTHDDWLSCRSPGADLHLRRLTHADPFHLPPAFDLFHSVATPILPPSLGDFKIFYMGINWERLGQQPSRHQAVLDLLDETDRLRIYGPEELRGVKVWDGFRSYQRSLPFDGVSIIEEIHRAGICLALSSQPHKDAALMSSRLFEGLAAGALIICDENPWAVTHFGDTLRYVDLRDSAEAVVQQILEHVDWARQNTAEALALATRAQNIFRQRFTMDASLAEIYRGLSARKAELAALCRPRIGNALVQVVFLLPDPRDDAVLDRQVAAAQTQMRQGFNSVILVDHRDVAATQAKCAARPGPVVTVQGAAVFQYASGGGMTRQNRLGSILKQVFTVAPREGLLCVVQAQDVIFSNHIALLVAALENNPSADYAWSKVIQLKADAQDEPQCVVAPALDLLSRDPATPLGPGRFLFRADRFELVLDLLLESLGLRAAVGLAIYAEGCATGRASMMTDVRNNGATGPDGAVVDTKQRLNAEVWRDLETIRDLDSVRFDVLSTYKVMRDEVHYEVANILENHARQQQGSLMPHALYLDRLSPGNRRVLLFQLMQGLPLARLLAQLLRKLLRAARLTLNLLRRRQP